MHYFLKIEANNRSNIQKSGITTNLVEKQIKIRNIIYQ
jgi:hypothetical protein